MAEEGTLTYIDAQHAIAHNKIMLIDDSTLVTGPFNFTRAAQDRENFGVHMGHSERYAGR